MSNHKFWTIKLSNQPTTVGMFVMTNGYTAVQSLSLLN